MIVATDRDVDRVKRHLADLGAGAFGLYKGPCFERRLQSRLRAHGSISVAAYADLLDRDRGERERLLSALAIGVTTFFRNPPAWQRLAELIAEGPLVSRFTGWSAGCSTGEEAYSIAMTLAQLVGSGAVVDWSVLGTDIDERSLAVAERGEYPIRAAADVAAMGEGMMTQCEVTAGQLRIRPDLRAGVSFRRADLVGAPPPMRCRLVVCRNVLIYFGAEGQARVIEHLVGALEPGGLLMLGKAELAATGPEHGLELVDRRERIYRRVV